MHTDTTQAAPTPKEKHRQHTELMRAQESPSRAQESPGQPMPAQDSICQPKTAKNSPGEQIAARHSRREPDATESP